MHRLNLKVRLPGQCVRSKVINSFPRKVVVCKIPVSGHQASENWQENQADCYCSSSERCPVLPSSEDGSTWPRRYKENIHHMDLINHAYLTWKTHHWAVLIAEGVATNRKAHIICPNTFRKFPSRHLFSRTILQNRLPHLLPHRRQKKLPVHYQRSARYCPPGVP